MSEDKNISEKMEYIYKESINFDILRYAQDILWEQDEFVVFYHGSEREAEVRYKMLLQSEGGVIVQVVNSMFGTQEHSAVDDLGAAAEFYIKLKELYERRSLGRALRCPGCVAFNSLDRKLRGWGEYQWDV